MSDDPEHTHDAVAWHVAATDRPVGNPPHEVYMMTDLVELYVWAGIRGVKVHLVSIAASGRHLYAAHCGAQSRVAKGAPRERVWHTSGFQT